MGDCDLPKILAVLHDMHCNNKRSQKAVDNTPAQIFDVIVIVSDSPHTLKRSTHCRLKLIYNALGNPTSRTPQRIRSSAAIAVIQINRLAVSACELVPQRIEFELAELFVHGMDHHLHTCTYYLTRDSVV